MTLTEYAAYVLSKPLWAIKPVYTGITQANGIIGLVIDRNGSFQTELFMIPFGLSVVEFHSHPNVDSIELHLAGKFTFKSNGVEYPSEVNKDLLLGQRNVANVPSTHIHGAILTPDCAGSFLSFQQWNNGVRPTSVALDFDLTRQDRDNQERLGKNFERKVITYPSNSNYE